MAYVTLRPRSHLRGRMGLLANTEPTAVRNTKQQNATGLCRNADSNGSSEMTFTSDFWHETKGVSFWLSNQTRMCTCEQEYSDRLES